LAGPLVLFAMTEGEPTVTSARLLAAKKTGPQAWEVATQTGAVKMLPFIAIGEEQYSTYLRVG
jgi:hypothetical protein